ncbi:unnamed protein product [Symbiodinium sp. CCMP2592]|nr:unnamed protein product [Symbiodinium sp. CCMP2592]
MDDEEKKTTPEKTPTLGDRIMVTQEAWLALLLNGWKTMEVRSSPAPPGPIWLGYAGRLYGSATISECRKLAPEDFESTRDQHRHVGRINQDDTLYGLLLTDVVPLAQPRDFYRPPTSKSWEVFRNGPEEKAPRKKNHKTPGTLDNALRDRTEGGEGAEDKAVEPSPGEAMPRRKRQRRVPALPLP